MTDYADKMCAIAECEFCDDHGIRNIVGGTCDHIDYAAIARRGMALVRAALEKP